eukprot:14839654-Alexandrium_andersonii.AAC.1
MCCFCASEAGASGDAATEAPSALALGASGQPRGKRVANPGLQARACASQAQLRVEPRATGQQRS